jgi:Family of unknown function (DUF5677)
MEELPVSTPEAVPMLTMNDPHAPVWEQLGALRNSTLLRQRFPKFADAFGSLHQLIKTVFDYSLDAETSSKADMCVYGLGRLCLEDFTEIVFLAEHNYGYAALKLLRGLYERAVSNEIIAENPGVEARRFVDFFPVADHKFNNRAATFYKNWNENPVVKTARANMGDAYKNKIDGYKYEPCVTCKRSALTSWTELDLNSLARSLGQSTNNAELKKLGKELDHAHFCCATIPNDYIHASIVPIMRRLSRGPEEAAMDPARFALSYAHIVILLALDTQDRHFKLRLDSAIEQCHKDRILAWPVPVPDPTTGEAESPESDVQAEG